MGSVNDWAAKAAEKICYDHGFVVRQGAGVVPDRYKAQRIAAIIATYAKPLMLLLQQTQKQHRHEEDSRRCCPRCTCKSWESVAQEHDDGNLDAEPTPNSENPCTCGADEWNKRVDAAIEG